MLKSLYAYLKHNLTYISHFSKIISTFNSLKIKFTYSLPPTDRKQCWIELGEPWKWMLYMSLVSIILFFIPALIISLCYVIIVKTIFEKGTYMAPKDKRKNLRNNASRDNDSDDDRESRRASSRGIIPRAKVKTVKMTFVIVIVCKYLLQKGCSE